MSGILNISASGRVTCVVPIDLFPAVAMAAEPEPETSSSCDCEVLKAWQTSEVIMRRLNQSMIVYLPSDAKKIKREHLGENVDLLAPILQNLGSSVDPLKFPLFVLTMLLPRSLCLLLCPGLRPSVNILAEYFRRLYMSSRPMHLRMPTSNLV